MSLSEKASAASISLTAFLSSFFTNDVTVPLIGVGVSTIAGAVLGTYAAIGYDETSRPRAKLFTLATATVIVSSALTGVLPRAAGWEWANGAVEGGVAALAALGCYFGLPEAIPAWRRLIRGFKLSDLHFFRRTPPPPEQDFSGEIPPTDGDPGR